MAKEKPFKPMPAQEVLQDFTFPLYGIDVLGEFGKQRAGTTPVGRNVRAQEPRALRLRGGARPGLSKYVPAILPDAPDAIIRQDTFDRADENPINVPSDGGSAWTVLNGSPQVISNAFATGVLGAVGYAFLKTGGVTDCTPKAVIGSIVNVGPVGILARVVDFNNYYLFGPTQSAFFFFKTVAGFQSNVSGAVGPAPTVGTTFWMRCQGTSFDCYVNGVLVFSTTDASLPTTSQNFGLYGASSLSAQWSYSTFSIIRNQSTTPHLVQHLNFIVDPTVAALLDNFDSQDDDAMADPSSGVRNPGRLIRTRGRTRRVLPRLSTGTSIRVKMDRPKKKPGQGSGRQPNRNKPGGGGFAFVQANQSLVTTPNASGALAYTSSVTAGNLLLVCAAVAQNGQAGALTVGVTDTLGNSYTQFADIEASATFNRLTCFWAKSLTSGSNTVTVTQSKNPAFAGVRIIALLEYSGQSTSPLDGTSTNAPGPAHSNPETTGSVSIAGTGDLLFGAFFQPSGNTLTPGAGFTLRLGDAGGAGIHCMDNLKTSTSAAVTATAITTLLATANVGASFKSRSTRTPRQVAEDQINALTRIIKRIEAVPRGPEDNAVYLAALRDSIGDLQKELESL